ncbi:hypothetical protein [Arenibaculum pallidiluteum]|uniref:hypothetical protein n=1 Tax=Arenibaculum pallidiluteum TaxID=2812559 RepID=UPI001A9778BE|nr:hypothetical protein [Arenibaculum pallidiluteum]
MDSRKTITLDELRNRLQGNGLVTEGEGVFRADHILIAARGDGGFVVKAVNENAEDGSRVLQRLRAQLSDVANVELMSTGNPLRSAS